MWLKNSKGAPDAMLTCCVMTLGVVLVKVALNGVSALGVEFGSIDAGLVGALLTPTLGAYVARKWTDTPRK